MTLSIGSVCANAGQESEGDWQRLDKNSQYYRFEQRMLRSKDGQRYYQLTVATPKSVAPLPGYPVLYMLDGNAALVELNDSLLSRLPSQERPVIVTVGYERNAQQARAFDYTPTPDTANDVYGGAASFWDFLEHNLKPSVSHHVPLDSQRQALWGHSYGGLFALYTLFHHPDSFQTYIAADPSLWWEQGAILNDAKRYQELTQRPVGQLLIQHSASHRTGSILSKDASRELAEQLSQLDELTVQYHDFFAHHHGSVRAASIPAALRLTVTSQ